MESPKPPIPPEALPDQLAEVFRSLRMGKHLCRDDGVIYRDLEQNEANYRLILERLGYELVCHGKGFYYLQGGGALSSQRLECLTIFMLLLFQDMEDRKFENRERMWEKTLLSRVFSVSELPHFATAEKRKMMSAVGVTPDSLSKKVMKVLASLGMLELMPQGQFRFRAPVYRFVDLCLQYASEEWAKQGQAEAVAAASATEQAPDTTNAESSDGEENP
jgi:hypothetical protein